MTQAKLLLDMYDVLDEANPSIEPLAEALEDEFEFLFETLAENFDDLFLDNGIAVNSYELLDEFEDQEAQDKIIALWQNDRLFRAFKRVCEKRSA